MHLTIPELDAFHKLYYSLMFYVNQKLRIAPKVADSEAYRVLPVQIQWEIREAYLDQPELLDVYLQENPDSLSSTELETMQSWRDYAIEGKFIVLRELNNCTLFLDVQPDGGLLPFGVTALTIPFRDMCQGTLPAVVETVLLPFQGKIIYDTLLVKRDVPFNRHIKQTLEEAYREIKKSGNFITSLVPSEPLPSSKPDFIAPPQSLRSKTAKSSKKQLPSASAKKPLAESPKPILSEKVQDLLEIITDLTDEFCETHLNEEYQLYCRKLTEMLACEQPSPLLRGKPESWACGIVRTIGWVNFLDDPNFEPHMKLTAIDQAFGVASSTGQAKSKTIRDLFQMVAFQPEWTLPSQMGSNPLIWLIEINGVPMDLRTAPREVQELAYQEGLIPYIPADRSPTP